jgi:sortase A
MKNVAKSRLALGFALLALGGLLVFARPRLQGTSEDTFASEPVKVQGFGQQADEAASIPQRIIIPELSIDLPVRKAPIVKGYWQVFPDSAAWGEGSGYPGKPGNEVIFAHAREGLFLPLKDVKEGMKVYVLADAAWYGYEVRQIKEVYPNQIEVIAPTEEETLTLYTCTGFQDSERLIVVAKRLAD